MNAQKTNNTGPFIVLTFVFFIVGFMTIINGQCQGPLKVAFLEHAGGLRNTLTTMISFCFFSGFLVNGAIGGKWINRYGYKTSLLRGLLVMIAGMSVYLISSWFAAQFSDLTLNIGQDKVPYGYFIFLLGAFLMGSSAALLQTVITPYVSAYDLPNTQPVQRVNIACAVNSLGTTLAPFFVTVVMFNGVSIDKVHAGQLIIPFLILTACVIVTRFVVSRLPLPDIENTRSGEGETLERSIWSFRHFKQGVIAIFFYVGAEVAVGTTVNLHAMELAGVNNAVSFFGKSHLIIGGLDLGIPALLATFYWGGMMIGRIISGSFSSISPRIQLTVSTISATVLILIATLTNNLWVLVSVGLFHSVMWGCIFTLAVKELKKYTSKASGLFMTGAFGGAVFPVLQGLLADVLGSWQWTWMLIVICELVMLYYALIGSRIKKEEKEITKNRFKIRDN